MHHLLLDVGVQVYDLRIWLAKSTPPMFWLRNFTSRGHATSTQLPSGNRQDTTSVDSSLKILSTKCTGFLSFQTKQWTFQAGHVQLCEILFPVLRPRTYLSYQPLLYQHNRFQNQLSQLKAWDYKRLSKGKSNFYPEYLQLNPLLPWHPDSFQYYLPVFQHKFEKHKYTHSYYWTNTTL